MFSFEGGLLCDWEHNNYAIYSIYFHLIYLDLLPQKKLPLVCIKEAEVKRNKES